MIIRMVLFWIFFVGLYAQPDTRIENEFNGVKGTVIRLHHWYFQDRDVEGAKSHPAAQWLTIPSYKEKYRPASGLFRISAMIRIMTPVPDGWEIGVSGNVGAAYDLYWDGIKIISNGTVSDSIAGEIPGLYFFPIRLSPALLHTGRHEIEIIFSNHSLWYDTMVPDFYFGDLSTFMKFVYRRQANSYFLLGICFITVIFNVLLFLYSGRRQPIYAIFAGACVVIMTGMIVNYRWVFHDVDATYKNFAYVALPLCTALLSILVPAFFTYQLDYPKRKYIISTAIIGNVMVLIVPLMLKEYAKWSLMVAVILSTIVIVRGIRLRMKDSVAAIIGMAVVVLLSVLDNRESMLGGQRLVYSFVIFVFFFNVVLARRFTKTEKLHRLAEMRSLSLEAELLKKHIQPHFIMNSLNSIIVWMRRDPENAVKIVEALADEFRIVSHIHHQRLIPLEQEIALCDAHVRIMNYRKGISIRFAVTGSTGGIEVPPMVLHTLVENALTHGYENRERGEIVLNVEPFAGGVRYRLWNDASAAEESGSSIGNGFRYVHARMEECYPQRWSMQSSRVESGWEVKIEILSANGKGLAI